MQFTRAEAARVWARLNPRIKERVRNGAALLDRKTRRKGGKRWPDRIDLTRLDMSIGYPDEGKPGDDCGCVCKQLFGTYELATLRLDIGGGVPFAFVTDNEQYRTLDRAWSALITMEREDAP